MKCVVRRSAATPGERPCKYFLRRFSDFDSGKEVLGQTTLAIVHRIASPRLIARTVALPQYID